MLNACNRVDACPEEYNMRAAGFFFPALVISGCVTVFMHDTGECSLVCTRVSAQDGAGRL